MQCHKMAWHLISRHSSETAVAQAIAFPLNSKELKLHFDLIRNKGNQAHNNEVLKAGSGTLIPSQQAGTPVKASDYMHCINCEALLKRKSLWRHIHVQVQAFTKMQHNKARQKSDPITLCLCTARTRWC